ncbi:MAG: cytochrome c maturation protein CcmE [Gammaproteobacteria bacterium]|nr:cytochrome c maturation protein CcmE [Gammaproteobacteria bacterium]
MKNRYQRGIRVALVLAGVGIAVALMLKAFDENILYFYTPRQVAAGEAPDGRRFRLGGLVTLGSIEREPGSLKVSFLVTDNHKTLPVEYEGVLPDLFRDGQGVIAHGAMNDQGVFVADEVLAKHDENYMPPEVAEALKEVHGENES